MAFRILQVFGAMNRGGAELRTLEMMRRMDRKRFSFDFWAVSAERGELDDEITNLGGTVYYAGRGVSRWLSLLRHLRRFKYDAIHSNVYLGSGLILAIAAMAGVPVRIAHFRTTNDGKANSLLRRAYRRSMLVLLRRYATNLLAVSEGAMAAAWGSNWKNDPRCRVIYLGVSCGSVLHEPDRLEVRQEFRLPINAIVVCHVGRVMRAKNHERLLSIFKALLQKNENFRLLIIGREDDTRLSNRLRFVARESGIHDAVVFAGLRTDVQRLVRASDIMIFPSLWEGLPGAVLEAAANGIPVLSSDIPGSLEIARHTDLVQCLSLERSDAEWADAAEKMLERGPAKCPSASPLSGTVFDSEISTGRFEECYQQSIETHHFRSSIMLKEVNG